MALSSHYGQYARPPDVQFEFLGMRASGSDMQRAGWAFEEMRSSIDRNPFEGDKRIIMRHQCGMTGLASCRERDLMYAVNHSLNMRSEMNAVFKVVRMTAKPEDFIILSNVPMEKYQARALDLDPFIRTVSNQWFRGSMADIYSQDVDEEIIVEPATVMGLLDQIKKLQAPDLARIRDENRKRDARDQADRPREIRHATILSLAV